MSDAVVDEASVRALAVIAQALAMVAHYDNHSAIVQSACLKRGDQTGKLTVGECNLSVVRVALVFRCKGLRWTIRRVRIVEVNPGKEGRAA